MKIFSFIIFFNLSLAKYILITGGTGYVGQYVTYYLAEKKYNIILLDRTIKIKFPHNNILYIQGSYGDSDLLDSIYKKYEIDSVIHLASQIGIESSFKDSLEFYENNVLNSFTLFKKTLQNNIDKIIYISSLCVYKSSDKPVKETHELEPLSPYANTKMITEIMLKDLCENNNAKYLIFRPFNISGKGFEIGVNRGKVNNKFFIQYLTDCILQNKPFFINGNDYNTKDGTCIRDFVHVLDVAEAIVKGFEYLLDGGDSNIFNIGSGKGYSLLEVVNFSENYMKNKCNLKIISKRRGDFECLISDNRKVIKLLNWVPTVKNLKKYFNKNVKSTYEN